MAKNKILKFTQKPPVLIFSIIIITLVIFSKIFNSSKTLIAPTIKASRDNNNSLFIAKNKAFEVEFGERNNHKPIVKYSTPKGNNISVALANTQISSEKIINNKDSVTFKDVGLNTDIRYTTLVNGIKEEIIIKKQISNNIFNFDLQTNDAYPNQETNNLYAGTFKDKNGNYLFHFEKPFAIDSQGNRTDNVSFQIKKPNSESNNYQLVLNVDQKWLQSPDRVYPITIDPTIVTDTITEFSSGEFNRTKNIGTTESSPIIESYYQELSADSNTVALWHLNESIGTTIADSSGNSNTGTITGTTLTTGQLGNARSFNGSSNYIYNSSPNLPTGSVMTAEAWIKPSGTYADTTYNGIVVWGTRTGANTFALSIQNTGRLSFASWGNDYVPTSGPVATANQWNHVAAVLNGSSISLYLNGQLVNSGTLASTPNVTSVNLTIGCLDNPGRYFNGSIDEVRISNKARTAEEIALDASRRPSSTYTSSVLDLTNTSSWNNFSWTTNGLATGDGETPFSTTSLVGQWNFNESSGTTAVNTGSCGTACNAVLVNFSNTSAQDVGVTSGWTANNRRWGTGALIFNGNDNYVYIPHNNSLNSSDNHFTFETWLYNKTNTDNYVFYKGATAPSFALEVDDQTNFDTFNVSFWDTAGNRYRSSDITDKNPIFDNGWHHIVGVLDNNMIYQYVDGKLTASSSFSGTFRTNTEDLSVGTYNKSTGTYNFNGIIDNIKLYTRSLSATEVLSNYNSSHLEFQTRVGNSSNSNDGTWEAWRPTTNETQIDSMDTSSTSWSWDNTATYMPKSKLNDSVIKFEGSGSLKLTTGIGQTDTNTKGLWHLDETGIGTGTTLYDSSSSNNNAIATGTTAVDGIIGKARSFNGTSQYIVKTTPTNMPSGASARTISAWIKPSAVSGFRCIVSYGTAATSQMLQLCLNGPNLYFTGWSNELSGTISLSAGNWYFVTATYDGTTAKIYINGTLDNSGAKTLNTVIDNTFGFNIGRGQDTAPGTYNYFNGLIDEVKISSVAQSAEEIAENYRLGNGHRLTKTISSTDFSSKTKLPFYVASDKLGTFSQFTYGNSAYANYEPDANTIGLWHLDEPAGSGAYIKDASGNNNNGTPTGTTSVKGKFGNARSFNGSSDYVTFTSNSNYNFGSGDFTINSWLYFTNVSKGYQMIFDRRGSSDSTGWLIYLETNNTINFLSSSVSSWDNVVLQTSIVPPINTWIHIAVVRNGSTFTFYLNGQPIKTGTFSGSIGDQTTNPTLGINRISPGGAFQGIIDEFQITKGLSRTADQIRQAYEIGARTHNITIDFKANLNSDLITNSSDLNFVVNETTYGSSSMANHIFTGDKIIVKENYNGTEYIAQGTVTSVNSSTGAISISSWDTGSTFPVNGFTANATVFKWQQEFFDITKPLSSQKNSVTYLTYQITDGSSGANIWLDDLRSSSGYLSNSSGSTITSSNGKRYFQYRTIFSQNSSPAPSAQLTSVTLNYVQNQTPNTPSLDLPSNSATNQILKPILKTTTTDGDSDYLRYKIQLCTNSSMTTNCQTFDQTSSQTGWSGQNTQTNTAYTSGTQATYTLQTNLNAGTTYYWRSYTIDPAGTNTWSSTQSTPYSFTTNSIPNIPSLDSPTNGATGQSFTPVLKTTGTDNNSDYLRYKIELCTNSSMTTNCQTFDQTSSQTGWSGQNTQTNTAYTSGTQATYTLQTNLNAGTTYYWRSYTIDPGGVNAWSATQSTPYSFATMNAPAAASQCLIQESPNDSQLTVNWVDNATNENGYLIQRSVNSGAWTDLYNYSANIISHIDSTVASNNTYQYRIAPYFTGPVYSTWCYTSVLNLGRGDFGLEGLELNDLILN